jgi:hypothetical protein
MGAQPAVGPLGAGLAWPAQPSLTELPLGNYVLAQFQHLVQEHERLRSELSRAYERLNIVLEISEEFSS